MKEYLEKLPEELKGLIYLARDIAAQNNLPIYLVGGIVRDLILGIKNLDLDFVVEGDGIKFAEDFFRVFKAKLIRHKRFGTATIILKPNLNPALPDELSGNSVIWKGGLKLDIASARKESYPFPAHLPVVSSGTLADDLFRRDFTINAMAISLCQHDFGALVDFFGGMADLKNKKIRIMHSLSFIDDPTRILRAVRFTKRLDFKIEPKTLRALKEAVRMKMPQKVHSHRMRDELILLLKEEYSLRQIKYLKELVGFDFIFPRLLVSEKNIQLINSAQKEVSWFKKNYPHRHLPDAWLIYFMALTDSLGAAELKDICRSFAFHKREENKILVYKNIHLKQLSVLRQKAVKPSCVFAFLEPLNYETIILLMAKNKNRNIHRHIEDFLSDYNGMRIHLNGEDLRQLGIMPGPDYQMIFQKILKAKLDGHLKTKDDELNFLKNRIYKRSRI